MRPGMLRLRRRASKYLAAGSQEISVLFTKVEMWTHIESFQSRTVAIEGAVVEIGELGRNGVDVCHFSGNRERDPKNEVGVDCWNSTLKVIQR